LDLFLSLAEKYGMRVLIRPGPYVCAEWDFGGLPARLLADPELEIRSNNLKFLKETEQYFAAVAPIIKKHIWSHENAENCIIMLQI
jgi:beta-galactosidase